MSFDAGELKGIVMKFVEGEVWVGFGENRWLSHHLEDAVERNVTFPLETPTRWLVSAAIWDDFL